MDPISAKLTSSALQNIGQQQISQTHTEPTFQSDKSSFAEMLDNQFAQESHSIGNEQLFQMVDSLIQDPNAQPFNAISGQEVQIDVVRAGEVEGGSAFKGGNLLEAFKDINNEQINLERTMETLQSGKKFSTGELLRLQTMTHLYAMHMEVGSKVGEGVNQSIRRFSDMQIG